MCIARMTMVMVTVLCAAEAIRCQELPPVGAEHENIALGKPYVLHPRPNYEHTRNDPHIPTRLTDGEYTDTSEGQFWVQPTTVGWANPTVEITIDLGEHFAIRGFSFNTAGGGGGVEWPVSIEVLVSVDGRRYHRVCDLVEESPPPPLRYNVPHRFATDQLMVHGRYVKFIVHRGGRLFIFVDEIEVFRGVDDWKRERPLPGPAIEYPMTLLENPFSLAFKARLDADLKSALAAIEQADVPDAVREDLLAEAKAIEADMDDLPELHSSPEFRGTFPLNDIHARTFALHGALRQAQRQPALVAWRANPWDYLLPTDLPPAPLAAQISVAAMRGETRAGAVNLTNCTTTDQSVMIAFNELPGGELPEYITVREVAWTDTFDRQSIAAALPAADRDERGWQVHIPAGMTRQVWFEVTPTALPPGVHSGATIITGDLAGEMSIPFELTVFDLDFPAQATLSLGGWDYSDRPSSSTSYGVTHENVEAFVAHLKDRRVTSTWASTWVMPHGTFNDDGTYLHTPDTTLFDEWIKRWSGAGGYYVYNFAPFWQGKIDGTGPDEPLFAKKMGQWASFWAEHARQRGVLERLWLVPIDEPHESAPAYEPMFISWSRAVKQAAPELKIWVDPYYVDPTNMLAEMIELADAVCPLLGQMFREGEAFEAFYRDLQSTGKRLEFYVINTVIGDPYTGFRLPAWWAFSMNAQAVSYWSFSDTGGGEGNSWNQYAARRTAYAPMFVSHDSVTPGKHMEAIREGVQDFEYLVMLRDRITALTAAGATHPQLPRARALLEDAPARVIRAGGAQETQWSAPKDRSIADAVRIEIARILETTAE